MCPRIPLPGFQTGSAGAEREIQRSATLDFDVAHPQHFSEFFSSLVSIPRQSRGLYGCEPLKAAVRVADAAPSSGVSGASTPLVRWLDICGGGGGGGSGSALHVIACGGPVPGEELVEAGVWPEIDEAGENICKVRVGIDAVELAGLDQRSGDGPVFRAVVVAGEECVLARESLWAHGAFDDVGIEIDATVVEEAGQAFPVFERITDGLSDGGFD